MKRVEPHASVFLRPQLFFSAWLWGALTGGVVAYAWMQRSSRQERRASEETTRKLRAVTRELLEGKMAKPEVLDKAKEKYGFLFDRGRVWETDEFLTVADQEETIVELEGELQDARHELTILRGLYAPDHAGVIPAEAKP